MFDGEVLDSNAGEVLDKYDPYRSGGGVSIDQPNSHRRNELADEVDAAHGAVEVLEVGVEAGGYDNDPVAFYGDRVGHVCELLYTRKGNADSE